MSATLRLAKWLGPWSASSATPRDISICEEVADGLVSKISVKIYRPEGGRIRGTYLVSQGLHFLGPDDPRMNRFCSVLANAGFEVIAPRLPSYMAMRLKASVIDEFKCVFTQLDRLSVLKTRPALFSISFGALPVLRLAADPDVRERVSAVITFGGYIDWIAALYYTIEGQVETANGVFEREPDPLNQPAIFMNFLEGMDLSETDASILHDAWFAYLRRTWGRDECRAREVHEPIAEEVALPLTSELRRLFMLGCGLGDQDEALKICLEADKRAPELGAALNVASHLEGISVPVHLFHGLDDDVFPHTQMEMLKAAFPSHSDVQTYLTGLYGHTGSQMGQLGGIVREMRTMLRMLHVLANAPESSRG